MTPSPQQERILDYVRTGTGSFIVEARAGSGKTTTLKLIANELPKTVSVLCLAFNKNIAMEMQERLPIHVQCKTFHSHCFGQLQRALPHRPRVDGDKVFKILKDKLNGQDFERYFKYVQRLVGYAKNAGLGTHLLPDESESWYTLIDHYSLQLDAGGTEEEAVAIAQKVLVANNANVQVIDFDDMLYLAVLRRISFDKFNYVLLDEGQDTNAIQRWILHQLINRAMGGRLGVVGDDAQSIYGFRGADSDAMELLRTEFNCEVFPLSVSYRCSQEVVAEAQKTVPEIESHPTAPIGSVEKLDRYDAELFQPEDAILCRVTAPLVTLAFGFIKREVGVRILGREIGAGLVALVKKLSTGDIDTLEQRLFQWRDREVAKALRRGHDSAAAAVEDKAECLSVFINQLPEYDRSITGLTRKIESLFSDNNRGLLTLCTVHKAKGLEWENVFILDRDKYMPSKWAKQSWELKQEHNLIYVAVTRAKLNLKYIKSGLWVQPKPVESESETKRKEILASL